VITSIQRQCISWCKCAPSQ